MVKRIIYKVEFPDVVISAVPTTEEIAMTKVVPTFTIERPCIHDVAVVEPEIVLLSIDNDAEFGPEYIAREPADAKLVS